MISQSSCLRITTVALPIHQVAQKHGLVRHARGFIVTSTNGRLTAGQILGECDENVPAELTRHVIDRQENPILEIVPGIGH